MASNLFKVTVIQYWLHDAWISPEGVPCPKDTPGARFVKTRKVKKGILGAKKVKKKSSKWYGRAPGNRKPVPLSTNKVAAQQILAELVKKAELGRAGISDPFEAHRKRPLTEHLADYRRELEARDNDPRYVTLVHSRLMALCKGCGFHLVNDLSASRAMDWLCQQRRNECAPELPAGQEQFTRSEAAKTLGMSATAFRDAVKRLSLPASGKGRARRYPRATVQAIRDRFGRGNSIQTTNYYVSHLKSFCRWLVKDGRIAESPVAHLEANNVEVDRRHDRRELSTDELRQLLEMTRPSKRAFRGMTGEDRFMLYATACGTGFRAGALASLTPAHFDLDSPTPTVALAARKNKSRKPRLQPLPTDLVELLRNYLADRPTNVPLWGGDWACKGEGAEMLRADLGDAGIPYVVEGPDGPLYADFHSLRHSYITALGRSGVDLRAAQELAGHSTPTLTAKYMHVRLHDLAGSVEKLPSFMPADKPLDKEARALRASGTDEVGLSPVCAGFAQAADPGCDRLRPPESATPSGPPGDDDASISETRGLVLDETDRDGLRARGPSRIRTGDGGFAIRCLTAWLRGRSLLCRGWYSHPPGTCQCDLAAARAVTNQTLSARL
jgi:integrase